jgi:cytosine/adenosine deaminase-related metal-dependent hydrolase
MILRAPVVLPMTRPPITDGAVVVDGTLITAVGTMREIAATHAGEVRDLGDVVLAPGLINAHCHFDYTGFAGKVPYRGSFADWLLDLVALKEETTDYRAGIQAGIAQSLTAGTTTVINIECFPELIPQLPATPLRIVWCRELIDLAEPVADVVFDGPLAPHAPYTVSAELYRRCAKSQQFVTTHLAETEEEDEMFRWGRGRLYEAMARLGRDMADCRHFGPVHLLNDYGVLGPTCLAAHANVLTQADVELLRATGTHVVHCPRSHRFFGRGVPRLPSLLDAGINVCLGTDSLASNDTLDMTAEMREVARNLPQWSAEQILGLATVNAAKALNQPHRLGRITGGAVADVIAVPRAGNVDPYEAVVFAEEPVAFMMIDGKVVLG